MAKDLRSQVFDKFTGVNNVLEAEQLGTDELRSGVNIDIDADNRIRRRKGSTQVYTGSAVHSFFGSNKLAYFMENGSIKRLHDDYTASTIRSGLAVDTKMVFKEVNGEVYYSNGSITGVIRNDFDRPWGLNIPGAQPTLATGLGSLSAGTYQVAITNVDTEGRESGARRATDITLTFDGGIALSNIPVPTDGNISGIRIYCTTPDGEALYRVAEVTAGTTTYTINAAGAGPVLRTQFVSPAPAGRIVEYHRGRMLVADGPNLYISDAYALEWFRLSQNYIPFPEDITLVAPVEGGVFISADKTYFFSGENLLESNVTVVSQSIAVYGTMDFVPGEYIGEGSAGIHVVWLSDFGPCLGSPSGAFSAVLQSRLATISATEGSGLFRQIDGISQYIGLSDKDPSKPSNMAVSDVASAEIVRNGITI